MSKMKQAIEIKTTATIPMYCEKCCITHKIIYEVVSEKPVVFKMSCPECGIEIRRAFEML